MQNSRLHELLKNEIEQVQKLNEIVFRSIEEKKLLSERLYEFEEKSVSLPNRLADKVASLGGSWKFIISFILFLFAWIIINAINLFSPFDRYPFILLNLILSTVAALQAPLIMMSQNRKEDKDRKRAVNDYLVNLKSELEIRNLHEKLDILMVDQMKILFEIQKVQMEMMEDIKAAVNPGYTEKQNFKTSTPLPT